MTSPENFGLAKSLQGHYSIRNVGGVTVFVLCTWSDDALYLYQVRENISNKDIEQTLFQK